MMQNKDQVSHYWGETAIRIDVHLARVNLNQHDICRSQTYIHQPFSRILQNVNGFTLPESTVLHHPTPSRTVSQGGYMLLPPSLHSHCAVVLSHNGIAEVLRLTEGMQLSTFNLDQQVYNERSSTDTDETSMTGQPCQLNHQKHIPCPVRSPFPSIFIVNFSRHFLSKEPLRMMNSSLDSYQLSMAKHY